MPVHAHDLRMLQRGAHVVLVCLRAVVLVAQQYEAGAERPAVQRAEVELADHHRRVHALRQLEAAHLPAVDVVADHVAVLRRRLHRERRRAPCPAASHIELAWVRALQLLADNAVVVLGDLGGEILQVGARAA